MIYGQGVPVAVLIGSDGLVVATVTLPRPTRRDANDFEELYLNLGPDTTNQDVTLYQGVRWHGKYVWTSHADNQADMATVRRVENWRGNELRVSLQPHASDLPTLRVLCEVQGLPMKLMEGRMLAEEIVIEFWEMGLRPNKPNPAWDRVHRAMGRGAIV